MSLAAVRIYTLAPGRLRIWFERFGPPEGSSELPHAGRTLRASEVVRAFRSAAALASGGPDKALSERAGQLVEPLLQYEGRRFGSGRTLHTTRTRAYWTDGAGSPRPGDVVYVHGADLLRDGRIVAPQAGASTWRSAFGTMRNGQVFLAVGSGSPAQFAGALQRSGARDAVLGTTGAQAVLSIGGRSYGQGSEGAPFWLYATDEGGSLLGPLLVGAGALGLFLLARRRKRGES